MNKYPVKTKLKHKNCNLLKEVVGYRTDLFGEYVALKVIDEFKWPPYHVPGQVQWYDISILKEYSEVLE